MVKPSSIISLIDLIFATLLDAKITLLFENFKKATSPIKNDKADRISLI